jgi:hypothetical protein
MEQVGAIGTMEDGTEVITMGALLSGDEAAIKWAGKHIFSSVVLMRVTDHAALAAERDAALQERDQALLREAALLANNEAERKTLVAHNARHATEAAALRDEVAGLREAAGWVQLAMDSVRGYGADRGGSLGDQYQIGNIGESQAAPSFRIYVGHLRMIEDAITSKGGEG